MEHVPRILLVDDEAQFWQPAIETAVRSFGPVVIDAALSADQCFLELNSGRRDSADGSQPYDLIILDNSFENDIDAGQNLLLRISQGPWKIPVLMFSSYHDPVRTIRCRALGAADYITKGHELKEIGLRIIALIEEQSSAVSHKMERQQIASGSGIIYASEAMDRVMEKVRIAAANPTLDVLIAGESGVGKESIAHAIHQARAESPFIRVNCGAIAKDLLESELFGHSKGAFTGAAAEKIGKFEAADGGDIFLDEIASLSSAGQVALLRVLENREITRVGSNTSRKIKVRVIAASNEDLEAKVLKGEFRRDLLSRLGGFSIALPALHERAEDISLIAGHFLKTWGAAEIKVDELVWEVFSQFRWLDNIRGLRNVMQSALAVTQAGSLTLAHLPQDFILKLHLFFQANGTGAKASHPAKSRFNHPSSSNTGIPLAPSALTDHQRESIVIHIDQHLSLDDARKSFLMQYIQAKRSLLGETISQTKLAASLGIPRPTLTRQMKEVGLVH